jgi:hypothetical protein
MMLDRARDFIGAAIHRLHYALCVIRFGPPVVTLEGGAQAIGVNFGGCGVEVDGEHCVLQNNTFASERYPAPPLRAGEAEAAQRETDGQA